MDDKTKQAVFVADMERRVGKLEDDMKEIKPLVYDTANSARQIEKSVEKMLANSDKIRGYFVAAFVSGIVGILFIALRAYMEVN